MANTGISDPTATTLLVSKMIPACPFEIVKYVAENLEEVSRAGQNAEDILAAAESVSTTAPIVLAAKDAVLAAESSVNLSEQYVVSLAGDVSVLHSDVVAKAAAADLAATQATNAAQEAVTAAQEASDTLSNRITKSELLLSTGAAMVGTADGRDLAARLLDFTSFESLGGSPDNASNHTALLALSGRSDIVMVTKPGDYIVDNSVIRQINYFRGMLFCAPGVTFKFTTESVRGLFFYGGRPKIMGARLDLVNAPETRQHNAPMLAVEESDGSLIDDCRVLRSAGAGALARLCTNIRVNNVEIYNTLADGLDFFNCNRVQLTNYLSDNTGDDGLAFLAYDSLPQSYDIVATNIIVRNSGTRGITVVGPEQVVISNFLIENTVGSGLMVYQDTSNSLRMPKNVLVSKGKIKNAGRKSAHIQFTATLNGTTTIDVTAMDAGSAAIVNGMAVYGPGVPSGATISFGGTGTGGVGTYTLSAAATLSGSRSLYEYSGNRYGIEQALCGDAQFTDIRVEAPLFRGFQSTNTNPAALETRNIIVVGAGDAGFNVIVAAGGSWVHSGCIAQGCQGMGFVCVANGIHRFTDRTVIECAKAGSVSGVDNRATYDVVNTGGIISGDMTVVIDNQATPTGYVMFLDGAGRGSYGFWQYFSNTNLYHVFQQPNAGNIAVGGTLKVRKGNQITTTGGTLTIGNPVGGEHFWMSNTLTSQLDISLPTFGLWHGMRYRFSNYNATSGFPIRIMNGATAVITIPANTQQSVEIEYDAVYGAWRVLGRYSF